MDGLLTAVVGAAPALTGTGLLLAVIVLLIRREMQTSERFAAELGRVEAAHDAELRELRVEIDGLRERNLALNQHLDLERERRRAVEDGVSGRHRTADAPGPWSGAGG